MIALTATDDRRLAHPWSGAVGLGNFMPHSIEEDDVTKETVAVPDNPDDPPVVAAPTFSMFELSLMPPILGATLWNQMMEACWPQPAPPLARAMADRPVRHDPHHQLVVPEPLEADGERGLVA